MKTRELSMENASTSEAERTWKINQSNCIGHSLYKHLECSEEERNHWCTQQQMSNW